MRLDSCEKNLWLALAKAINLSDSQKEKGRLLYLKHQDDGFLTLSCEEVMEIDSEVWCNFFYRYALTRKNILSARVSKKKNWFKPKATVYWDLRNLPSEFIETRQNEPANNIKQRSLVHFCALLVCCPEEHIILQNNYRSDVYGAATNVKKRHHVWREFSLFQKIFPIEIAEEMSWNLWVQSIRLLKKKMFLEVPLSLSSKMPFLYQNQELVSWHFIEDEPLREGEETLRAQKVRMRLENTHQTTLEDAFYHYGIVPLRSSINPHHLPLRVLNKKDSDLDKEPSFILLKEVCLYWASHGGIDGFVFNDTFNNVLEVSSQRIIERLKELLPYSIILRNRESAQSFLFNETNRDTNTLIHYFEQNDLMADWQFKRAHHLISSYESLSPNKNAILFSIFCSVFSENKTVIPYALNVNEHTKDILRIISKAGEIGKERNLLPLKKQGLWHEEDGLLIQRNTYKDGSQQIIFFNESCYEPTYDLKKWHPTWNLETICFYDFTSPSVNTYLSYSSVIPSPSIGEGTVVIIY